MRAPLLLGAVVVVVLSVMVVAALRGAGAEVEVKKAPPLTPPPSPVVAAEPPSVASATSVTSPPDQLVPRPGEPDKPATRVPVDYRAVRRALAAAPGPSSPEALPEPVPVMPPGPPTSEWSQATVVSPFGAGSPAPAVTRALVALRPRLADCFEPTTQGRWGRLGPAFSHLEGLPPPAVGPAILMLEVESDGQSLRIVDAPAEIRGSASDGTLNCAQAALRGATLPVATQDAKRFRMRWPLRP